MLNEHLYLILVQNQLINHYNMYIFNSHLILLHFTVIYIGLKPSYYIYLMIIKLQHFTSFRISTSFNTYGFSIHLSRYQYYYVYLLSLSILYQVYKAPSLTWAVSDQLLLLQLLLQFIRKCH